MSFLLYAAGIIFAFGLVIFVHEFGHFIVAKKSGVKVERFSFGLGPEMIGFKWGETRYCIAWLPLGGEVRMSGDAVTDDKGNPLPVDPTVDHSRDFFHQPWYRRVAIALAGPTMNYLLAFVIFFGMLLIWGEPNQTNKTEIGEVVAGMPAEKAGLQKGDKLIKIQNEPVDDFMTIQAKINARPELATEVVIERAGQQQTLTVTPQKDPEGTKGLIGIRPADPVVTRASIGVVDSVKKAGWQCWNITAFTLYYLGQKISAREKPDVAGPIGIGQVIVKAVKSGAEDFFYLIALISVAIGLFNLFPVPLLDGGHVLYYVIEGIRGKPISHKVMAKANMVGLALLLSLLVFATINDVQRFRTPGDAKPSEASSAAAESPAK